MSTPGPTFLQSYHYLPMSKIEEDPSPPSFDNLVRCGFEKYDCCSLDIIWQVHLTSSRIFPVFRSTREPPSPAQALEC